MSLLLARRRSLLFPSEAAAAGYADEVLADSPVAYWRLEETSGPIAYDEVGSNNLTVTGADLDQLGQVGSGAAFDGIDDRMDASDEITFTDSTGAIEFWVRTENTSAVFIFDIVVGSRCLLWTSSGTANWEVYIAGSYRFAIARSNLPTDGAWRHIVIEWGAGGSRAVINGVQRGASGTVMPTSFSSTFKWAARTNNAAYLLGGLDEIAVYNHALGDARILAHYNAGVA